MFVDLDWPLNASSLLSASAELLVLLYVNDRHNAITHTWKYRVLPGVVRYTFIVLRSQICALTQNSGDATDYHILVKSGTQFRSVPEIITTAIDGCSKDARRRGKPPSPALPCPALPPLRSRSLRSRTPWIQLEGLGERCKLPQWGLGSPSRQRFWCVLRV